jgi:hypothetical protein
MPKDLLNQTGVSNSSFLLPGFDEYMLGYKDRSAALHTDHTQKIVPGSNGMFLSTIRPPQAVISYNRYHASLDY